LGETIYKVTVKATKDAAEFVFYTKNVDTARGAGSNLDQDGLGFERLEIQRVDKVPAEARVF
jgi:hypothetical protein